MLKDRNLANFYWVIENEKYLNDVYRSQNFSFYQEVFFHPVIRKIIRSLLLQKIAVIFMVIFSPIEVIPKFFKTLLFSCLSKQKMISEERVFLYFSPALYRVSKFVGIRHNDAWLCQNCSNLSENFEGYVYKADRLVTVFEAMKAYLACIEVAYGSLFKYGPSLAYISLSSFDWFILYFATLHVSINSELFFCNHKDSYMVLIDALPHKKKILIQHGSEVITNVSTEESKYLYKYLHSFDIWTQNIPHKWTTLSKVICFSVKESVALKSSIISCSPAIELCDNSIILTPRVDNRKVLLIIGRFSLFYEQEKQIIENTADYKARIIIKNHPLENKNCYSDLQNQYSFEVINEQVFPEADLVIGYESTLMSQYHEQGINIMYYEDLDYAVIEQILKD